MLLTLSDIVSFTNLKKQDIFQTSSHSPRLNLDRKVLGTRLLGGQFQPSKNWNSVNILVSTWPLEKDIFPFLAGRIRQILISRSQAIQIKSSTACIVMSL